ncbi:hypothetical protein I4U23_004001 [Adineta vaga]|nr:hypothetical protein I4U23_004001 [Adineta vaga]
MNNSSLILERDANTEDDNLQKPNIYLRHLPSPQSIPKQAHDFFEEIRENLSRTIQAGEFQPGFIVWTRKLKEFISLYGFYFTKIDHVKLIKYYLSIVSTTDLSYSVAQICFELLMDLLQYVHLILRDDLTIDWHIFYRWLKLVKDYQHKSYLIVSLPKEFELSIIQCTQSASPYFSSTATQEILDEVRPQLCPFDSISMCNAMQVFDYFLPLHLPPHLHNQGFKLWFSEFFGIWANINNETVWELYLVNIFSQLAWYNIGHIDWNQWLNQIFTHFLRGFSLPIGQAQKTTKKLIYSMEGVAQWIVAMIGNGNSCLQHLEDLLIAIRSFYYPSNTGYFQKQLVDFLFNLTQQFVNRVHLERQTRSIWFFAPPESHRLTEQDITDFVNCIKEYTFISIFNKDYSEKAAEVCQFLSVLRPELIIPSIVDKLFISIDDIDEAHRFTSLMYCVTRISRQLVRQTPSYSHGQTYVVPLLLSVLPGIDVNDIDKTAVTIDLLDVILMLITCVDCSSALAVRNDLTEIEKEVCLSTAMFEEFITRFLDEIFEIIDSLATDYMDAPTINDHPTEYDIFQRRLISIITSIVQHCSSNLFRIVRQKIVNFVTGSVFVSKAKLLVIGLVRAIVKCHPEETLKYLLPQTCQTIERIFDKAERNLLIDDKGDQELTWHLYLFAELVHARGDILLMYKEMIQTCFHSCIRILHADSYETVALAIKNLLQSLLNVYPIEFGRIVENLDESFVDFLPIRTWGQNAEFDQFQVHYHIPNIDEINFACNFINTFLYAELSLLNDTDSKLSKQDRRRSLTIIHSIALGCFRIVPRIESKEIPDLSQSVISYDSQSQSRYSIYYQDLKPEFRENLRMRLLLDIGNLLDKLIENQPNDVLSIREALSICILTSEYYGIFSRDVIEKYEEILSITEIVLNPILGKRDFPRFLNIKQMELKLEEFEIHNFRLLTEIDKQIGFKLFDLSISPYREIRCKAQDELFHFIEHYNLSWTIFINRIVEQLNASGDIHHHQIKGCLYILLGNDKFFLPIKHSWTMLNEILPLIVRRNQTNRFSIQNLIERIQQKIEAEFETQTLIPDVDHQAVCGAIELWYPLETNEIETSKQICKQHREINLLSYYHLIDKLHSLLRDKTLSWGQEKIAISFLCLLIRKDAPLSPTCIETCTNFLIHDNAELREYAFKIVTALCHIQKPSRIYLEKSTDELLSSADQSLEKISNDKCQAGVRDDNLWITFNDYELPKTQNEWEETCFLNKIYYGYYQWPKRINLFRNFGLAFIDNFIEQLHLLIRRKTHAKQEHQLAAEIIAGMIRGSKYWTLDMLNELWEKLTPFLDEVCANLSPDLFVYWGSCFQFSMENQDPRRMFHSINFLLGLINNQTWMNTFNEASRWYLVQSLAVFHWRIPSVWCTIYERAKELIDHPSKLIRQMITIVLPLTLQFDLTLFGGKSTYYPTFKELIDDTREGLDRAIAICGSKSRINHAAETGVLDNEVHQALNLIQSVVAIQGQLFALCHQPIRDTTLQMFSYFCDIGSITFNDDDGFKNHLMSIRAFIGMAYLHTDLIEVLIEQIEHVCTKSKWQARLAALEFIQYFVFCNLFNIRSYVQRLHKLVFTCLFDERLEVRLIASTTLAGFYQCGYIPVTDTDLKHFRKMSKTAYRTIVNGEKVISAKDIVKRHGGILGLCAIVQANPYDIPDYVPDTLMILCEHSHDPHLIQRSIKQCLSEFRRTHHDSWHEHRMKFTGDQLGILVDVLISHNYYV